MLVSSSQPEMLVHAPPTSNVLLLGGMLREYPCVGPSIDGSRTVERRRRGVSGDSPLETLKRLPAVVVLEQIPIPSIAIEQSGTILFANSAFARMVGHSQDSLQGLSFPQVFDTASAAVCALSGLCAPANLVVQLRHREGWTVRARMSKSAMQRRDDPMLVTFEDLTEQLWMDQQ